MKLLTLDIETDVKTQEVVVITTRGPDGAINLWKPDDPEAFRYIKDVMADQNVMLVGHNIAFDCAALQFLPLWNILLWDFYDAGRVTDTMIREKLRNLSVGRLDTFDYGLDNLAEKHFGISIAKDKDDPTSWRMRFGELKNTAFEQWPADALAYCRQDVEITYALWNAQTKKDGAALDLVRPDGKITNETEQVRAALALRLMSIGGIAVDPVKTEQLEKDWTAQIVEGRAKADKYYKRKEIKRGPNPRVEITKNMTLLREDVAAELGELCPRTEPSKLHPLGCAKTDSETLELCESPAIRALAEMSGAEKLLTAFLPVLKQGVVYPSYDILKATGRTSCFGPNIQQLPRKGGVRECLVAREGNCFIEADYSSIELCSLAQVHLNLFGKSTMADAINSGKDLHLVTAARILNRPYETLDKKDPAVKDARQLSKAANFGYPGGMGPEKFCLYAKASYGLNISLAQSAKLRQAWMQAYPEMKLYFDYVSDMTRSPWELVQHVSGRIRGGCGFCDGANSLFQGLAADGAKAGLYLVAREAYRLDSNSPLRGAFGGAFIHDEQILEISLDKAPAAGVRLGELMVRGMKAYIPDVLVKAEPLLMRKWFKDAIPVFNEKGELVPWKP